MITKWATSIANKLAELFLAVLKAVSTVAGASYAYNFHFHTLRHTYTTNLLSNGAAPKDVQELLGHSDVSTTMNVYAHANREGKRNSARLLDKVAGE